jgi:VanZ family protein
MLKRRKLIWLLPIIWLCITVYLSFQDGDSSEHLSHVIAEKICAINNSPQYAYEYEVALRDLAHIGTHFVLAFLTALAAYSSNDRHLHPGIASAILCSIIAILSETGQLFIPGRTFEWIDILQNLLGVVYGSTCLIFVYSVKKYLETVRE